MKAPIVSSRHLSAFAIDVHHELEQTGLFSKIKIKKTGLPSCALVVVCLLVDTLKSQSEVAVILEKVWIEAPLGYGEGKDSYQVALLTGQVQMSFETSAGEGSVTGRIEVVGFK